MADQEQEDALHDAGSLEQAPAEAVAVAVHIRPLIDSEREAGCQESLFVTPGNDTSQVRTHAWMRALVLAAAASCRRGMHTSGNTANTGRVAYSAPPERMRVNLLLLLLNR